MSLRSWFDKSLYTGISFGALLLSASAFSEDVIVDFETGDLSQANFSFVGDGQWQINSLIHLDNRYNLRTPVLEHGQSSSLVLSEVFTGYRIYYTLNVSTEIGDKVELLVDGEIKKTYSGEQQVIDDIYISNGLHHEVIWRFTKDTTLSGGQDGAWIESIRFERAPADDIDGDGIIDYVDNCIHIPNPSQINTDNADDGGDACDDDDDNDGIEDVEDAYPTDKTRSGDTDGDGLDDYIDNDDDNDGVNDENDAFPLNANEQLDTDGDFRGNNTDLDDDNDGMPDVWEIAQGFEPLIKEDGLADADGDGFTNEWEFYHNTHPHQADDNVGDEGKPLWQYKVNTLYNQFGGHSIAADGSIYLGSADLIKLSAQGEFQWRHEFSDSINTRPIIGNNGKVYVLADKTIRALYPDGKQAWQYQMQRASKLYKDIDDNLVYLDSGNVYVVNGNGQLTRMFAAPESSNYFLGADSNNDYYFSSNRYDQQIKRYDSKITVTDSSGVPKWQYQVPSDYGQVTNKFALGNDGTVYLYTFTYNTQAFNKITSHLLAIKPHDTGGELLWQRPFPSVATFISDFGPVVSDNGIIYVNGRDLNFYALNPDGSVLFSVPTEHIHNSTATLGANGDFYFSTSDNSLVAVDSLGQIKWRLRDMVKAGHFVLLDFQGDLSVVTPDNHYVKIDAQSGGLLSSSWPMTGFDLSGGLSQDVDSDGDRMPDSYETAMQLPVDDASHAIEDTDLDGHSDLAEFVAGSSPVDASDMPSLVEQFEWFAKFSNVSESDIRVAISGDVLFGKSWGFNRLSSQGIQTGAVSEYGIISSNRDISIDNKDIAYVASKTGIAAYDNKQQLLWHWQSASQLFSGKAVAIDAQGNVLVNSHSGVVHSVSQFGALNWTKNIGAGGQAVIDGAGNSYFITGINGETVTALNKDGEQLWQVQYEDPLATGITLDGQGALHFANSQGVVYALNTDGSAKWQMDLGAFFQTDAVIGNDGQLHYLSTTGALYGLNNDGTQAWLLNVNKPVSSAAAIDANGTIYFIAGADLHQVNSQGQLVSTIEDLVVDIFSNLTISAQGILYINSKESLIAFDTLSGGHGTSHWPMAGANPLGTSSLGIIVSDSDGDGIADIHDNCPNIANTEQLDHDGDLVGNVCDDDDDNDGVIDIDDELPFDRSETSDIDGDGIGDNADKDDDNDGLSDVWELSQGLEPTVYNDPLADSDNDGLTTRQEFLNNLSIHEAYTGSKAGLIKWQAQGIKDTEGAFVMDDNDQFYYLKKVQYSGVSLVALDKYGQQIWEQSLAQSYLADPIVTSAGQVVVAVGSSYGSNVYAYNAQGELQWQQTVANGAVRHLATNQLGHTIVSAGRDLLFAIDNEGNEVFYYRQDIGFFDAMVVGADNSIYLSGDNDYPKRFSAKGVPREVHLAYQRPDLIGFNHLGEYILLDGSIITIHDHNWKQKYKHQIPDYRSGYGTIKSQLLSDDSGVIYRRIQHEDDSSSIVRIGPNGSLLPAIANAGYYTNIALDNAGGIVYFDFDSNLTVSEGNGQKRWSRRIATQPYGNIKLDSQGDVVFATEAGIVMGIFNDADAAANGWSMQDGNANGSSNMLLSNDDIDGDGIVNSNDNCPYVSNENQTNTDGVDDGGDACDTDDDNDGFSDFADALPLDANEHLDFDGDGIGDNRDSDDDNDGVDDSQDAFPQDDSEWLDTDLDGVGNNSDNDDDNDGIDDHWELTFGLNPLSALDAQADSDGDGFSNMAEYLAGSDPQSIHHTPNSGGTVRWAEPMATFEIESNNQNALSLGDENLLYITDKNSNLNVIEPNGKLKVVVQPSNNRVSSDVLVDDNGDLYVAGRYEQLMKTSNVGQTIWSYQPSPRLNFSATAKGLNGNVLAVGENAVVAFNSGGDVIWQYDTDSDFYHDLVVNKNGFAYAYNTDGNVHVIDDSGELSRLIEVSQLEGIRASNPIKMILGNDDQLIFHGGQQLFYVYGANGEQLWSYKHNSNLISGIVSGVNQAFYVVDNNGQLLKLSADGQLSWKTTNINNTISYQSYVLSPAPLVGDNGTIYYSNGQNVLYAIFPDGRQSWAKTFDNQINSQLTMDEHGLLYLLTTEDGWNATSVLFGINTNSHGLSDSYWPMSGANVKQHSANTSLVASHDYDGDGILDVNDNCPMVANSLQTNTDGAEDGGDACDNDDDNDNMPDYWEALYGLDPLNAADADADSDNDGLSNGIEYDSNTAPNNGDSYPFTHWGAELSRISLDVGMNYRMATLLDGSLHFGTGDDGRLFIFDNQGQLVSQHIPEQSIVSDIAPVVGFDQAQNAQIYLLGYDDQNATTHVYSYDPLGHLLWHQNIADSGPNNLSVAPNGDVYVNLGSKGYAVFDPQGELKWRNNEWHVTDSVFAHTPINTALIKTSSGLKAIDSNGNEIWHYQINNTSDLQLAMDSDGTVLIGRKQDLIKLNLAGELVWQVSTDSSSRMSAPLLDNSGHVYFAESYSIQKLHANGDLMWKRVLPAGVSQMMLTDNSHILALLNNNQIYVYDAQGNKLSEFQMPLFGATDEVNLLSTGKLFVAHNSQNLHELVVFDVDAAKLLDSPWPVAQQNYQGTYTLPLAKLAQDADGDGIANEVDNCVWFYNPNQLDNDLDGAVNGGDLCDADDDNDGVLDVDDVFPLDDGESLDNDHDGIGDNRDSDDDNDGVSDEDDEFPFDSSEWLDTDGDGIGNMEDEDDDNDGMNDEWELTNGLNSLLDDANLDNDGDGVSNIDEMLAQSNPNDASIYPGIAGTLAWQLDSSVYSNTSQFALNPSNDLMFKKSAGYSSASTYSLTAGQLNWQVDDLSYKKQVIDQDGVLYTTDKNLYLVAINSNGQKLWTSSEKFGFAQSALSASGYWVVADTINLHMYDTATGLNLWQVVMPSSISQVIVDDAGLVYVRTKDSADQTPIIEAFDMTGQSVWQYRLEGYEYYISEMVLDSHGRLYIFDGEQLIHQVGRDGQLISTIDLGSDISRLSQILIDDKDRLYLFDEHGDSVIALNADFSIRWKHEYDSDLMSPVLGSDNVLYFLVRGHYGDYIKALDEYGREVWSHSKDVGYSDHLMLDSEGLLYFFNAGSVEVIYTQQAGIGKGGWKSTHQNMQMTDGVELLTESGDKDGDGVTDLLDNCPWIANENQLNTDGSDDGGDACDGDDDNDNISDLWEIKNGLNAIDSADAVVDADNDGHSNLVEYQNDSDPNDSGSYPQSLYGNRQWRSEESVRFEVNLGIDNQGNSYISCSYNRLCALDQNGESLWQHDFAENIENNSVIDNDGKLLVVSGSSLYRFNQTGEIDWQFDSDELLGSNKPVVSTQGLIFLLNNKGSLLAFDHQGTQQWRFDSGGTTEFEPVVLANGGVVYMSAVGDDMWLNHIDWAGQKVTEVKLNIAGSMIVPLALSFDEYIYLATDDAMLIKLDIQGNFVWRKSLNSNIKFGVVVDEQNHVYFVDMASDIYKFDAQGELKFMIGNNHDVSHLLLGQKGGDALHQELLYFEANQGLVSIDKTGIRLWSSDIGRSNSALRKMVLLPDGYIRTTSRYDYVDSINVSINGIADNSWGTLGGNRLSQGRIDIVLVDSDNDGIADSIDNCVNDYNPDQLNTDGAADGGNVCDSDDDNDGVNDDDDAFPLDAGETLDTDGDGIGNNADLDDDGDGIADSWEIANGLDSLDASDAALDNDGDGYTNYQEYLANSDPNDADSVPSALGVGALNVIIQLLFSDENINRNIDKQPTEPVPPVTGAKTN